MYAWLNLRFTVEKRTRAFTAGLEACGYKVKRGMTNKPQPGDIFVTWNRIGNANRIAKIFEQAGNKVLVTENASWGNEFNGQNWYHIARGRHNTSGCFDYLGPDRWDALDVPVAPWRKVGATLILPQRGIGSHPTAMPRDWPARAKKKFGGRVRPHPGQRACTPLEDDLATVGRVITWGSGAAIKALMMGIPVKSYMPNWIGEQDNTTEGRLAMFRRLAWAQWTLEEITDGEPFRRLL